MRVSVPTARLLVLLAGGALALSGCASDKPPSFGDRILAAGAAHQELGNQWHEAEAMKDEAEDDIRAAEEAIEEAEADLKDAQKRLAKSKRALAEAESEFQRRFPGQATVNPE